MHVIAAKAVALKEALEPQFKDYQKAVIENAQTLAKTLISNGVDIVSGGTDNHLLLVDLRKVNLTGKEAEQILDSVGITCNKNTIPQDPQSPFVTSGIRLGTPAVTTRGMSKKEMITIAETIANTLKNPNDETIKSQTRHTVETLCKNFPLYIQYAAR